MPNSSLAAFIDRLPQMDDESLLRTLIRFISAPGEYQPEAIAAVRDEVARRGLTPAQLKDVTNRVRQEALESIYDDAVDLAQEGRTIAHIEAHLKARGVDDASAAEMAKRAWDMPTGQRKRAGRRNIISGATLCFVGLLLVVVPYLLGATSPGGGPFLIVWGIVLAGFLQFLRGVGQLAR